MAETENYVSYFVYFSDLKPIYSYFLSIILITMNSQHSYKHFKRADVQCNKGERGPRNDDFKEESEVEHTTTLTLVLTPEAKTY